MAALAAAGGLRAGLAPEQARDIVWTIISPEVYELLVIDRGWTPSSTSGGSPRP